VGGKAQGLCGGKLGRGMLRRESQEELEKNGTRRAEYTSKKAECNARGMALVLFDMSEQRAIERVRLGRLRK